MRARGILLCRNTNAHFAIVEVYQSIVVLPQAVMGEWACRQDAWAPDRWQGDDGLVVPP